MTRTQLPAWFGVIGVSSAGLAYWLWPRSIDAKIYANQAIAVDETVRRFRLVVPHSLSAERVPILFAFHGTGDTPESIAAYSHLDRTAAENSFLLVYPAAARSMWMTVNLDPDHLDQNPDVRFFDYLLDHLADRFPIDRTRVYLAGMSNGAAFAQLVAFARPGVAAVVAHSGAKPPELQHAPHAFPILLLVGEDDPAINALRSTAAVYRQQGHPERLVAVQGLGHEWSIKHNGVLWNFLSRHQRNGQVPSRAVHGEFMPTP